MTALQPYPAYRASGVEWLRQVPEHWEVRRLKHWLEINRQVLPEDTDPEYEFDYLDIGSVETGRLTEPPKRLRFGSAPSRARRIVARGDTIVSTVRTYLKAVWYAKNPEERLIASTGFAVLTPDRNAAPGFVSYTCQSDPFTNRVTAESVGIAYPAISETRFATFSVCVPPLREQTAIARFLDDADRRIRRYIRAKERLIELLEEERRATIHEAVTGRIDVRTGHPYPAYKDSGVEWLGRVPEHWEIRRVKNAVGTSPKGIQIGPFGSSLTQLRDEDTGYKLYGQENTISGDFRRGSRWITQDQFRQLRHYELLPDDVVLTRKGSLGKCRLVPHGLQRGIMDSDTIRVRLDPTIVDQEFMVLLLHRATYLRSQIESVRRGAVLGGLNTSTIANLATVLPPLGEQKEIKAKIGRFLDRIGSRTDAVARQIALLREYRTRLIADVVTGKLDVREAAANLPATDTLADDRDRPGTIPTEPNPHSTESHMAKEAIS